MPSRRVDGTFTSRSCLFRALRVGFRTCPCEAKKKGLAGYGKEFGNLIHHNYPSQDYDDLMSGVDAVIDKGYIDEDQLLRLLSIWLQ